MRSRSKSAPTGRERYAPAFSSGGDTSLRKITEIWEDMIDMKFFRNSLAAASKVAALASCVVFTGSIAGAADFNWRSQEGQTINVLFTNHPWPNAIKDMTSEFTEKTGIKVRVEILNEDPIRARLSTLMQARSSDVDAFISLKIREGAVYNKAGWYADLNPLLKDASLTSPDFNFEDFGEGLRKNEIFDGKLTGVPINVEGPLFYWRKDIFAKCNVPEPQYLEDIPAAAKTISECDKSVNAWTARGVRNAIPYPMASFVFNLGGDFKSADKTKPGLCQEKTIAGLQMYGDLLKTYGAVGASNHSFPQVVELLGQGKVAMTHESSNEFSNIAKFPGRAEDLAIKVLPPGKETGISKPVAFGWGLSMSNFSKRKEATWLFMQWATSPEIEARLIQAGVAPPRSSVFDGADMKKFTDELPIRKSWADAIRQISKTGTGDYASPTDKVPQTREIIGKVVQDYLLGNNTIKDGACEADKALLALQ